MQRNTKSLKRNDETRKGILIAPSKLPRFSLCLRFLLSTSHPLLATNVGFGPKIHGTDGKPGFWHSIGTVISVNLAAAPDGPNARPWRSRKAASMISFS